MTDEDHALASHQRLTGDRTNRGIPEQPAGWSGGTVRWRIVESRGARIRHDNELATAARPDCQR
jgi:hypothetical protein